MGKIIFPEECLYNYTEIRHTWRTTENTNFVQFSTTATNTTQSQSDFFGE